MSTQNSKIKRRGISGIVFTACMFAGMGLGMLFGKMTAGMFIGMASGFAFMAIIYLVRYERRAEEQLPEDQ